MEPQARFEFAFRLELKRNLAASSLPRKRSNLAKLLGPVASGVPTDNGDKLFSLLDSRRFGSLEQAVQVDLILAQVPIVVV